MDKEIRFTMRREGFFEALYNNTIIGRLELDITNSFAEWAWVSQPFRRQKIATRLYDFAEETLGWKLVSSESLSRLAQKFWKNRG